MDKVEAYQVLTMQLANLLDNSTLVSNLVNEGRATTLVQVKGGLYTVSFEVQGSDVIGQIHNNNSHIFQVLEERVSIKKFLKAP